MKHLVLALIMVSTAASSASQSLDSTELTEYLNVCAVSTKYLTKEDKQRGLELTAKLEVAMADRNVKIINPPKATAMKKCIENLMQEVEKNGN